MKCSLPPHQPLSFKTFEEYEVHYQKTHVNRCQECGKNFPDEHFLHLHIAENHDPISASRRERGEKIYACLTPTCDRLCSTPTKRRLHMIDKHQFPKDYDFFIINNGIDHRNSMLRTQHRRRSSTMNSSSNPTTTLTGDGNGGTRRRRGESSASTMEVVRDEKEEDDSEEDDDDDDEESSEEEPAAPIQKASIKPTTPSKTVKPTSPQAKEESSSSEEEEDESSDSEPTNSTKKPISSPNAKSPKHTPLKLRGRGGFGRVGQRNTPSTYLPPLTSTSPPPLSNPVSTTKAPTKPIAGEKRTEEGTVDGLDEVLSGMAALRFVPNSVRKAREKARVNAATADAAAARK